MSPSKQFYHCFGCGAHGTAIGFLMEHGGRSFPEAVEELARAKENLKGRLLLSLESTSNRMTRLGKATVTDVPLLSIEEVVRRLEAVTAEEVAELAGSLFAPAGLSAAGIGPDEGRFHEAVAQINPALLSKAA